MPVRRERPQDQHSIAALHRDAFGADHGDTIANLVTELRRADPDAVSLVFEDAQVVVGHIMISRGLLDAPRRLVEVGCLSPLAVAHRSQRRGIGSQLVHHGLQTMDLRAVPLVFLEGDPGYYSRLGFLAARGLGFRKPSLRIPDDAFQVVRLSGYQPWMTGTFVYSDTFWQLDCVGLRADDI